MQSTPSPLTGTTRTTESPLTLPSLARTAIVAGRAARLRCPHCGGAPVLAAWRVGRSWGTVRERCAACGFRFERSDDRYFAGAMLVNLISAELLFAFAFVAAILITWPAVPWDALTYWGAAGMLLLPLLFYPVSKVLWLAADVLVRPVTPNELE
jgi:uncharacterized protein (DUF983 family)